jgi:hypothetical protein
MEPRLATISLGMKLVVLAAVDLAMLRGVPRSLLRSPRSPAVRAGMIEVLPSEGGWP